MTLTREQAIGLLAAAAAYDNRKPNPDSVLAWKTASEIAGWSFPDALDAVHAHYARSSEWLMPGHITEALRGRRELPPPYEALPGPPPAAPDHRAAVLNKIRSMLGRSS